MMFGYDPGKVTGTVTNTTNSTNPAGYTVNSDSREPCPLCNGLGGWDRSGIPMPAEPVVPERTKCQGCDGSGVFSGWLREVMS